MPLLMDNTMEQMKTASNYQYSGTRADQLGASEYTLVGITQDISGSVSDFRVDMEKTLKTIIESCQKSPRSENLMARLLAFNSMFTELHGFKVLGTINVDDYDGILNTGGMTALFDACMSSIEAVNDYAKILVDQDFMVNAIIFIITDGMDNESSSVPKDVKKAIDKVIKDEYLESLTVVLIGVDSGDAQIIPYLETFQKEANITQFVDMGQATPSKLARLAKFISKSVSSTSQALNSGAPSQPLQF